MGNAADASKTRRLRSTVLVVGVPFMALALGCSSKETSEPCDGSSSCSEAGHFRPPPPADAKPKKTGCNPGDLGDFQPVPIQAVKRTACTAEQIHALAAACAPGAGGAACAAAKTDPANETCIEANCVFTGYSSVPITLGKTPIPTAASSWGPFVHIGDYAPVDASASLLSSPGFDEFATGACLLAENPANADCAQNAAALLQCETAACAPSCPLPSASDPPSVQASLTTAYSRCATAADVLPTACKRFSDQNVKCMTGSSPSSCYTGTQASFETAIQQQCGIPADGGVCLPESIWSFAPTPLTPLVSPSCSPSQIKSFVMACIDTSATQATCNAWFTPSNMACGQNCIYTTYSTVDLTPGKNPVPPAQPSWGPNIAVLDSAGGQVDYFDQGGCLILADPSQAACGQAQSAFLQCGVAACAGNCGLPNSSESSAAFARTNQALANCQSVSGYSVCQAYFTAAVMCIMAVPSTSPGRFCIDGSLTSTNPAARDSAFEKLLTLQCGQPDAGTPDGGAD